MKCPNCGAETSAAVCEYCGTQINNPQGCCKRCGSPNLSFRRENQGEIKGKKTKQIVHRTVGVCKDCGYTWFEDEKASPKRKTWLWVLGWIFIFPLPLTILMIKNKKLKLWLKILIIAASWVVYLLIALAGKSSSNTTVGESLPAETISSNTVEQTEPAAQIPILNVELSVEPKVNDEDGTVLFGITTNLPENTKLMVTVSNDEGYRAQDTAVIMNNGKGYTAEFSNQGKGLKGKYQVSVTMSLPKMQLESVQKVIGKKGEHISGEFVKPATIDDSNVVEGIFEFEF